MNNLQAMIQNLMDGFKLNNENFLDNENIKMCIESYWKEYFISEIKNNKINFTYENLLEEIKNFHISVEPTEAFAIDDRLPTWLDQAIRTNEEGEIRFNQYKSQLRKNGKGDMVNQLDADTFKILDSCHDPRNCDQAWDRRGLVYGNVQSGKTANYIGLINRALDLGYKIIIILTGVTEDLRRQTQTRVDEGVISINKRNTSKDLFTATTISNDLSKGVDNYIRANCSLKRNSIWVIKKNKTVLENLILWLDTQRKEQGSEKIKNTPILIIDDEADNASIQSLSKKDFEKWDQAIELDNSEEELNSDQEKKLEQARESVIKAINRSIRVALSLMYNKTFVAYTATPYSIISQSSNDLSREVKIRGQKFKIDADDLFPRDFIIPIKPGRSYIGIERLYNSDDKLNLPANININETYKEKLDNIFPTKRGHDYLFEKIPQSLKDAIIHFIIVIIIKKHRGIIGYNSMLIHTSHLTFKADYVADKVDDYLKDLMNDLRVTDSKILERFNFIFKKIVKTAQNKLFKQYFNLDSEFPKSITKNDIKTVLLPEKDDVKLELVSYHSSKDPNLIHKEHTLNYELPKNEFKNYIVVGGNRLSRGLTLEGLSISYFVRGSTRQDSLYQMARWFGYRSGYEDLIKIYMPNDQIMWFKSIFKLETELRNDFDENNDPENPTLPKNAIIKIALHTDDDLHLTPSQRKKFPSICDPGKLRKTREWLTHLNGGNFSRKVDKDDGKQKQNMSSVKSLFEKLYDRYNVKLFDNETILKGTSAYKSKNISFTEIPSHEIVSFLNSFKFYDGDFKMKTLAGYIDENSLSLKNWSVSLVNRNTNKENIYNDWNVSKYLKNDDDQEFLKLTQRKYTLVRDYYQVGSIIETKARDSTFDLIDSENFEMFSSDINEQISKNIRETKKIPLLLIYPAKYNDFIYPLLYVYCPLIKSNKPVKYLYRKSYQK